VGLNCALGAKQMRPYLADLARIADCFVSCYPNAGLPNELGEYDDTPEHMAKVLGGFAREGLLRGYARYGDEPRRDVYLYGLLR